MDIVDKIQELISGKATFASLEKELGIGNGTIGKWRKQSPSCDSIVKIANRLDCSVDYLLGRTDNPQAHKSSTSVSVGNVSGNSGAIGVGNTVTNSVASLDEYQKRLLELFNELSIDERTELLGDLKYNLTKKAAQNDSTAENSKDNLNYGHIGGAFQCPFIKKARSVTILLKSNSDDTIIGYDCDYPNCDVALCQLQKDYPIGVLDREAKRKLNKNR